jgi:hypothetical protein
MPIEDRQRVCERRPIRDCRTRANHARVVAHNVGQQPGGYPATAHRRQAPAFDRRQMLSHGVEGADVGACAQEATGDLLLVVQRDPRDRHGHERGCAARHEDDKCILRADGARNIQCCTTSSNASRAGNRMIGLQRP